MTSPLIRREAKQRLLTASDVLAILDYDPETGVFVWKVDPWTGPRRRGKVAGSVTSLGYRFIEIKSLKYPAHRLAWLVSHGQWPPNDIDHINGDTLDNRLSNLREATRSENCANRRLTSGGVSGVKGVHWNKKLKKWQVGIKRLGQRIHVGVFADIEDAKAAYLRAASETFGDFARPDT